MALNDRSRRARNKTRNKAQELKGQIKEATGNPRLEAKGRSDQTRANLKQAVETTCR